MLVLPYGHDQSVYGRQWVTIGLIALNALVFGCTYAAGLGAEDQLQGAFEALLEAREIYPDGRVDASLLEGTPRSVRDAFAGVVPIQIDESAPLTDADLAVEDATRDLLSALERAPTQRFGYRPGAPSPLTFVSSMLVHADVWHLLGNMLFLWLAGAAIECFWSRGPYLALYALAGAGAVIVQHLTTSDPMIPVVGASGAIAGLLGAFVVGIRRRAPACSTRARASHRAFPRARVRADPGVAMLQIAWALLAVDDGVAYWAHVGASRSASPARSR